MSTARRTNTARPSSVWNPLNAIRSVGQAFDWAAASITTSSKDGLSNPRTTSTTTAAKPTFNTPGPTWLPSDFLHVTPSSKLDEPLLQPTAAHVRHGTFLRPDPKGQHVELQSELALLRAKIAWKDYDFESMTVHAKAALEHALAIGHEVYISKVCLYVAVAAFGSGDFDAGDELLRVVDVGGKLRGVFREGEWIESIQKQVVVLRETRRFMRAESLHGMSLAAQNTVSQKPSVRFDISGTPSIVFRGKLVKNGRLRTESLEPVPGVNRVDSFTPNEDVDLASELDSLDNEDDEDEFTDEDEVTYEDGMAEEDEVTNVGISAAMEDEKKEERSRRGSTAVPNTAIDLQSELSELEELEDDDEDEQLEV